MFDELCLLELMEKLQSQFSYSELCKLSPEQKTKYKMLLDEFKRVNNSSFSTSEKGNALENLVSYLLQISGNIFLVSQNVRTSSNEIDQVIKLNQKGRALLSHGLISPRFSCFLGECKNYSKKVSVTYVGKFYSLLQTTCITTGILFSYHGTTGSNWNHASGLIKKIYLQRESEANRVAIIDFNITDFEAINNGDNLLEILDKKLAALQLDTTISELVSAHPAEKLLKNV